MKITDLIPSKVFESTAKVAYALEMLYTALENGGYEFADEIIEELIDLVATQPKNVPVIDFCRVNLELGKYAKTVEAATFIGHSLEHFKTVVKKAKRTHLNPFSKFKDTDIKAALYGHLAIPIAVEVNLAIVENTGEYNFVRGTVIASDDELHFPIGIKPYVETWFYVHDKVTGYLSRTGISDMKEAREILANTMTVEESTTIDGLATWMSIMGNSPAPDSLGKLYKTLESAYVEPDYDMMTMHLYMTHTKGMQKTAPRIQATKRKVAEKVLERARLEQPMLTLPEYRLRFEDGLSQRKKIDLRRSMVNRVAEQGVQDSLALKPLEDALQAKLPIWVLMSDKQQIQATKADRVTQVSVAGDIGQEIAQLKSMVQQQLRIANDSKSTDKMKSGALARAMTTAKAIVALRKDAGYFEQNNATKSGIFQNMDSTVLQDDGAAFDSIIEQLAGGTASDE